MIYADTDFFLALMKKPDWLKESAKTLYDQHRERLWTSPATMIELLLVAAEYGLDPERLLVDAMEIAELREGDAGVFLRAANFVKEKGVNVFDSLHAAFCGHGGTILSSDKVFDRLGLTRIRLEA